MPATEEFARNLRSLHVVSAASAFALLAATLWMMQADYADEWRGSRDVLRMTSMLWFIKRSGYGDRQWLRLHIALQAGVAVATFCGEAR